jgi:hypothetical protein
MPLCKPSLRVTDSKRYRKRRDDIAAFMNALTRFLSVCQGGEETYVAYETVTPLPGKESEATRLAAEVDRLSGRAAFALGSQFFIEWKPRGTFQTVRVNPAAQWRTILEYDPRFPPEAIFAVCNQAVGLLEAWASDAEKHEQTFTGKVERVTRWMRPHLPRDHGGNVRTALIASIVGIPAALLVAYVAYLLGWG